MLSESARMSSAAEARFRIRSPASTRRAVRVLALDGPSDRGVARLRACPASGVVALESAALRDGDGGLLEAVSTADLVVMIATAGHDASAAAAIGEACSRDRVMTTTVVIRPSSASDDALSRTLAQVRPWSLMVVIASDDLYVDDILRSFR
jgi:hypothetical protein